MRKAISFGLVLCGLGGQMTAQELEQPQMRCAEWKGQKKVHAKTTVASLAEDEYDMKHVKFDVNVSNTSTAIGGNVTTTAQVVATSMPAYVFELHSALIVDSVKINGQLRPVTSSGIVRTVTLPAPLPQNSMFTAQVFYHGNSGSTPGFFGNGIRRQQSPSWGAWVTYTLSEPYGAKDWWPTKQSLTDKIDSADIWITVPSTLKAGSNGVLQNVTPVGATQSRYEWKTRIPIDFYLLSLSVGPYVEYSYYMHFPNSNDSMLYQNYIYSNPQTLPFWKQEIDSVPQMIVFLSELFGRYPFWQEKYGHTMAPLSGGMEHQTMTTQGNFDPTLSIHELAHQWFGNNVTCGSWKDIWLNEGFASYAEYLYMEHFWSLAQAKNSMLDIHMDVMQDPDGSVYVADTTNSNNIFDGRLIYNKGAAIVHSLRFAFNNDSLFFLALRNYQAQFQNGTALTQDLNAVCQQVLGQNLDTFFNQWIYGEGYPIYTATWNQIGNDVIVKLEQTTSHPSVPLFHTPIELRLASAAGDTVIRVHNSMATQTYQLKWDETMQSMNLDPNNWILNETISVTKDVTLLDVNHVAKTSFKVFPNPAKTAWTVSALGGDSKLELMDMNGRAIWTGTATEQATVPAAGLANGVYLLRVSNSQESSTTKLIKQ